MTISFVCFAEYQGPEPDVTALNQQPHLHKSRFERLKPILNDPAHQYWPHLCPRVYTRNIKLLYSPDSTGESEAEALWQEFLKQHKCSEPEDFELNLIDIGNGKRVYTWVGAAVWHRDPIVQLTRVAPFTREDCWCTCCYRVKVVKNKLGEWYCCYCIQGVKNGTWRHSKRDCVHL